MGNIVDFKLEFNNQLYFVMDILGDELRIPLMRYDYDPIDRLFGAICNLSPSGVRFADVATVYKYGIGGLIRDGIPEFGCIKDHIYFENEGTIDDNGEQFSANPIYIYVPYKSSLEWNTEDEDVETIKWSLEKHPKGIFDFKVRITIEYKSSGRTYSYSVPYKELCLAAGRLGTDIFKSTGITGFKETFLRGSMDISKILFLKKYALRKYGEELKTCDFNPEKNFFVSDYKSDLELLCKDI